MRKTSYVVCAAIAAAVLSPSFAANEHPPLTQWYTNYASSGRGASISSPCEFPEGNEAKYVIGGDRGEHFFGAVFADKKGQREEFTVDLGQARKLGVIDFYCELVRRAPEHLTIQVSDKSARGPWTTVLDLKPIYHGHKAYLENVNVRWIHVDLGENTDGLGSRVGHLYAYPRFKLKPAADVLQELIPHFRRDFADLAAFWKAVDDKRWNDACDELIKRYAAGGARVKAEFAGGKPSPRTQNWMDNKVEDGKNTYQFSSSDWDWHAQMLGAPTANLGMLPGAYSIFNDVANAYAATGEEKYARKMADLLTDWLQDNPYPGWHADESGDLIDAWVGLKTSGRCSVLCHKVLPVFCADDLAFTRDLKMNLILSVWQHMELLDIIRPHVGGNWLTNVNSGLFGNSIMFPEFVEQKRWLANSMESFESKTFSTDVYPSGREVEDSTMYVGIATSQITGQYGEIRKAGLKLSDESERKMSLLWDPLAWVSWPDGSDPTVGDCHRAAILPKGGKPVKDEYLELYDRPDLVYINTRGQEGKPPSQTSRAFDGWYVFRTPWEEKPYEDARQMFFKCSKGRTHSHLDQLEVLLYAYGREMLTDPGMSAYGLPSNKYFRSTAYHNTACVNESDQDDKAGEEHAWCPGKFADFADASFHYGTVIHRRQIVLLKSGKGLPDYWLVSDRFNGRQTEHTFDINYHLSVGADPVVTGKSAHTRWSDGGNLLIAGSEAGPVPTIEDYKIQDRGDEAPAKCVRFRVKGNPCVRFDNFLLPYQGSRAPAFAAEEIKPDGGDNAKSAAAFAVTTDAGVDIVMMNTEPGRKLSFGGGMLISDAQALILRFGKSGELLHAFQCGGTETIHRGKQAISVTPSAAFAEL